MAKRDPILRGEPRIRGRDIPEGLRGEHARLSRDLKLGRHRCAVEPKQMQLVPVRGVREDAPGGVVLRLVVELDEVGHRRAGVLDLLEPVPEGCHCDRAVGVEGVAAVRPDDDADDACGLCACVWV